MVNGSRRARIDRRARGISLFGIANVIFLSLLCLITLYPLYYILIHSFNEGVDSLNGGLYLWVRKFTLFNYQYVLGNNVIMNSYKITISRTLLGTVLGLFVTGITAYGMSFRSMPGRKALMGLIIVSMLFSGGLIPYYIQLSKLHLADTFWVYIFPAMFNIWNMFVLMKSFMALPDSLHESAFIDGAGEITILAKIVLPLSKPTLAAIALFIAVSHWNDWYSGAFFVSTAKL
ncbi:MAG: carbohydrate ABC transporter permease, partial [Clostridiales bacterium]|nr:carbohydrate ABC transporter permease [Clostridiales bacterium]